MKTDKMVRNSWATNADGIRVKRCCASCRHKLIMMEGNRLCELKHEKVKKAFKCRRWEMSDLLVKLKIKN